MADTNQSDPIVVIDNMPTALAVLDSFNPKKTQPQAEPAAAPAPVLPEAPAQPGLGSRLWNKLVNAAGYGPPPPVAIVHFELGHGKSETTIIKDGHATTTFTAGTSHAEVVKAGQAITNAGASNLTAVAAHHDVAPKSTAAVTNAVEVTHR